jgi:acylphosphatase
MRAVAVTIIGHVQGVGFRYSARAHALDLGVAGWIRNSRHGAVEAFVQGDSNAVDDFVAWLRHGPPGATVQTVDIADEVADPAATSFTIRA